MKMIIALTVLFVLLPIGLLANGPAGQEFYVAPYGSDSNPGTSARPFATLERARDAVRTLKKSGELAEGGVTVWVREGVYPVLQTFKLEAQDSGSKKSPIVYRACEGEQVRLVGGREVRYFHSVTDSDVLRRLDPAAHGKVLQADLKSQGITDFGSLQVRGFGKPNVPAALELFFEDKPMPLAQWPNNDWAITAEVPAGPNGGKFNYDGDRPSRWKEAKDIWMHGYWTWPWADSYVKVASIDTEKKEIVTEPPHGVYGYQKGKRYRVLNVLEELDMPGEWYVDRETGMLYFWPPSEIKRGSVYVSLIEDPMVVLQDASYITLRGMTLEYCRGEAVQVLGGVGNRIAGCTLRNIGTVAVTLREGKNNGVVSCDIYNIGDGGVIIHAGDRATLTPAGNFVENCHFHDFSLWDRTYKPAISNMGVGNRIAHNLIHDAPHSAIIQNGNDHIVEYNDISRVCLETGDAGAFYMGRDWTQRGNIVRYNYFHDMGSYDDKFSAHGFSETMAIYLDDWTSGTTIYGNIFCKANRAVMIGGGRDNLVENNIIVDCAPAVWMDARGLGWAKNYFDGRLNTLFDRFKEVNADKPPYSTRYPQLAVLLNDEPAVPKGNRIVRNICVGKRWFEHALEGLDVKTLVVMEDNLTEGDPEFVDAESRDFRLKPGSPAFKLGFKQIPVEKIGLYKDQYRTALPKAR